MPAAITIKCLCIESPQLHLHSQVINKDNTLGLDIGRFINHFQVNTHIDIDLSSLEHRPITNEMELFHFNFAGSSENDQEILSLLEMNSRRVVKASCSGTIHGVPYWFVLHFPGCVNNSLSTFCGAYSGSHWRQAVVVLKEELSVEEGQELLVTATCKDSCVSVSVQTLS